MADALVVNCDNCGQAGDFTHYGTSLVASMILGYRKLWCRGCYDLMFFTCKNCDKGFISLEECVKTPDGQNWCKACFSITYTICTRCGEYNHTDHTKSVQPGWPRRRLDPQQRDYDTLCNSCITEHCTICRDCGDLVYSGVSVLVDRYSVCPYCYVTGYVTCDECDDVIHLEDACCHGDSCYCAHCNPYNTDYDPNGFHNHSGRTTEIGSERCYGLELETDECGGYDALYEHPAWGAKDDCTVSGKEFYSDILDGDEGLEAILDWAQLAFSNGWEAGDSAGYHLHLDLREERDNSCYAMAYAYRRFEAVWLSFVKSHRHSNSYSHEIRWSCADVKRAVGRETYDEWSRHVSRFMWCNTLAYYDHCTVEIRLHEGTCDRDEIINWVKAHTRFVDWACTEGFAGVEKALYGMDNNELFSFLVKRIWNDKKLGEYYTKKAQHHNHGFITGEVDSPARDQPTRAPNLQRVRGTFPF